MSEVALDRIPAAVVWALGLTQILGYGTLYYSFGVLAPAMAAEFAWSEEWLYGVLSASLLIAGLVAPISGAWADRFGAGRVMAWGSAAAAASLVLCALAPERISFIAGLVAIEVASAFVLYATAFAALAQISPARARVSITHLTLIAGFASTIFWPLTSALHSAMSWREVYLLYGLANLAICLPVHFWLARHTKRIGAVASGIPTSASAPLVPQGQERRALVLMLFAFAILSFASSAILVHMVPMLTALELGGAAVLAATVFGPAQVLSRLVNMQFGRGLSAQALALLAAALPPTALAILVLTAPWAGGALAFAVLFGFGSGLSSIVSGVLPMALFGPAGYGKRLGLLSSARLIASAFAPFLFSVMVAATSPKLAIGAVALVAVCAVIAFGAIWWISRERPMPHVAKVPVTK